MTQSQGGCFLINPFYSAHINSSVAAVQTCFCFIIVAAVIVLGIGALFLLFVLLYSQRVSSQSCETLGELLHKPTLTNDKMGIAGVYEIWIIRADKPSGMLIEEEKNL